MASVIKDVLYIVVIIIVAQSCRLVDDPYTLLTFTHELGVCAVIDSVT